VKVAFAFISSWLVSNDWATSVCGIMYPGTPRFHGSNCRMPHRAFGRLCSKRASELAAPSSKPDERGRPVSHEASLTFLRCPQMPLELARGMTQARPSANSKCTSPQGRPLRLPVMRRRFAKAANPYANRPCWYWRTFQASRLVRSCTPSEYLISTSEPHA
jgi:hypothetical protein